MRMKLILVALLFYLTILKTCAVSSASTPDPLSSTGDSPGSEALARSPALLLLATRAMGGSPDTMHHSLSRLNVFSTLFPSFSDTALLPTDRPLITHETTFTYFTTRFVGETSLISTRKETITNYELDTLVKPTPLILTRTVLRASAASRYPQRPFGSSSTDVVVTKRPEIEGSSDPRDPPAHPTPNVLPGPSLIPTRDPPNHHSSHVHPTTAPLVEFPITPTPVTYFTTFTYFTTELESGHPVVRSREQVISTVVRGKVLPTRVRSLPGAWRSKRHAMASEEATANRDLNHLQPNDRLLIQEGSILDPLSSMVHAIIPQPTSASAPAAAVSSSASAPDATSPLIPTRPHPPAASDRATGLLSQSTWSEINRSITTLHTRQVYGTLIGSLYAHYAESQSSVLSPSPRLAISATSSTSKEDRVTATSTAADGRAGNTAKDGPVIQADLTPVSVVHSSEVNDLLLTLYTTEVYQTRISGFAAHFTRTTSNIVSSTHDPSISLSEPTQSHSIRNPIPSIHFPTPVRPRKQTASITTITTITTTVTATALTTVSPAEALPGKENNSRLDDHTDQLHTPINQLHNKSQSLAPDEHDEHDGSDSEANSDQPEGAEEHKKGGEYMNENYSDYEAGEEAAPEISDETNHQLHPKHRPPREENARPFLSLDEEEPETGSYTHRKPEFSSPSSSSLFAGLNERAVPPAADSSPQAGYSSRNRQEIPARYAGVFGQRVSHRNQKPADQAEKQSEAGTPVSSRQPHRIHSSPHSSHSHPSPDRPPNHRLSPRRPAPNLSPSVPDSQSISSESRAAGHRSRGVNNRRTRPLVAVAAEANDSPKTANPAAGRPTKRRNGAIRAASRYRSPDRSTQTVHELSATQTRRPGSRRRSQSAKTIRTITLAAETQSSIPSEWHPTPSLPSSTQPPKSILTVTSIVSWTRTFPIRHGFRTSYATVTSSVFNTSLIQPGDYEIQADPTNSLHFITVLNRGRVESNNVKTQIIVTSTSLSEVKLVPFRVGYSTRTDTQTSSYVLTSLKTIFSTAVLPPAFTFLTSTASHVTTLTLTSTAVVSLIVAGKTLLSTLLSTVLKEATITTTKTIPLPLFLATTTSSPAPVSSSPAAFLFTTLITFQLTGDSGDVTKVVTPVTLPIHSPALHTKVERRAIRPSSGLDSDLVPLSAAAKPAHGSLPSLSPSPPASPLPPALYASFSSPVSSCPIDPCLTQSLTAISKGPTSELYKETATVVREVREEGFEKSLKEDKYATGGFKRRKLHQFGNDFAFNLNPQSSNPNPFFRDFSRVVSQPQSFPGADGAGRPLEGSDFDPLQAHNTFGVRPGFQRVKVANPFARLPTQSPQPSLPQPQGGFSPAGDNSPFTRFQRVVAPSAESQLRPQSNFRRVPVFSNQLPPPVAAPPPPPPPQPQLQSPPPTTLSVTSPSTQPFHEDDTPIPLVITPTSRPTGSGERPAFRRVRPGTQAATAGQRVRPAAGSSTRIRDNTSENVIINLETTPAPQTASRATTENPESVTVSSPESRRIVRIRKPGSGGGRRRVAVRPAASSTLRTPAQRDPADDEKANNALDAEESPSIQGSSAFGSRLQDETSASPALRFPAVVSTSAGEQAIVPLTYYTTYTYLTTVLRGSHTLVTSRVSSTSSISSQVLDESAIHFLRQSSGSIVPTKVVNIGSKTKGPTTTIVNIASEIRATHSDLPHILAAASESPAIRNTRKPLIEAPSEEVKTIALSQLEKIPKTFLTKYTYYYTIIDGTNTRKSTRSEVASSRADSAAAQHLHSFKVQPTIQDGILSLGSGPETVHLGRRSFGKSTTEVNLAIETYLHLDGITNAVVESVPTALPDPIHKPTTPLPDPTTSLRGSFSSDVPASDPKLTRTPQIEATNSRVLIRTRKPLRPADNSIRSEVLRSRGQGSARLRVRVRPTSTAVTSQVTSPSAVDEAPVTPPVTTTDGAVNGGEPTTPPPLEIDSSRLEPELSSPSKKKVAVTVTRKQFGGLNRLRTRTRSVFRETTPAAAAPTTSSATPSTSYSPSTRIPSRFRVASRVIRPNFSSISLNANEHPEPLDPVSDHNVPTASISYTTAPISRGSETSIRSLSISSDVSPSATPVVLSSSPAPIAPQSPVLVTYFTTTTHTIPFTVGDKTLYTTFEMTNTRVATEAASAAAASPTARQAEQQSPSEPVHLPAPSSYPPVAAVPSTIAPSFASEESDVNTMYTTFTFFTTFFSGDSSTVRSSEKVVSNIVTATHAAADSISSAPVAASATTAQSVQPSLRQPLTVVETTNRIETSTVYSTQTFYATLFNGNSSTITPIEETKSEILTLREPLKITKTIVAADSTGASPSSVYTRTYYTSHAQQVSSNIVTFTVSSPSQPSAPSTSVAPLNQYEADSPPDPSLLTTRSTHTTLTHLITLYSGTNTVLSSVTEISPTVVTETVGFTAFNKNLFLQHNSIQRTQTAATQNRLLTSFVPSVSTHVTTHTYFTTLFSGTTSFVSSRSETASSLVTLYVPSPAPSRPAIQATTTSTDLEPSLLSTSTWTSTSTSSAQPETTSSPAEKEPSSSTPAESSATSEVVTAAQSTSPATTTKQTETEAAPTTPASVVDLEDILSGSGGHKKINDNLGAAIKDIVQLLAAASRQNATSAAAPESGKTPQPVYIPSLEEVTAATPTLPTFGAEDDVVAVFRPDRDETVPVLETSVRSRIVSTTTGSSTFSATPSLSEKSAHQSAAKSTHSVHSHDSGATSATFIDAEATTPHRASDAVHATRFVTSVESQTRTLTLTTTKVYYTRDSPLTITSVLTTVIPPKTFVSTIIGSRTILGTAAEASKTAALVPSEMAEGSTTITTTTLIFNSITTTVVRTLLIPTDVQPTKSISSRAGVTKSPGSARPTRKPLSSVRTTAKTTPPPGPVIKAAGAPRKRQPLPKPVVPPEPVHAVPAPAKPAVGKGNATVNRVPMTTRVVPVADDDECAPACNAANKEVCVERDGKYKCDCRPGYARKDGALQCKETNNFVLLVRVMKAGDDDVSYKKDFTNKESNEFKKLAKLTEEEVGKAYSNSDLKHNYLSADVTRIVRSYDDEEGVLVNLTLRVMNDENVNEDLLREELVKSLEESESVPTPAFITAEVEDVVDLDECSHVDMNDCSSAALCINEPGSYTCKCKGIFTDLDPTNPGRSCAAELKMCDLCNGRGDCYRDESGDTTSCKCHRMYLGRYCEINGILLATLLPVAAILSIISVCCIVYCCRKYRKRTNISKGFRNISQFGPPTIGAGTLDRKAMLGQETSSENSDHFRGNPYEGPGQTSMDPDSNGSTPRRRRGSEPGLERCLGPSGAGAGYPGGGPPQVVIPRARHANQPDAADPLPEPCPGSKFRIRSPDGNDRREEHRQSPPAVSKPPWMPQSVPLPAGQDASRFKKRRVQPDQLSFRSKESKYSCSPGDLMNFYAPDETTSVYSRATSAIVPQASPKRRLHQPPGGSSKLWGEWNEGRETRPMSDVSASAPFARTGRRDSDSDRFRSAMSEAARSCNESILFPATKSKSGGFGSEEARNARSQQPGYTKGWRGNMLIPEREESELSTTSFLAKRNQADRYPFTEDPSLAATRRSFFPNSNWGTLPSGNDD